MANITSLLKYSLKTNIVKSILFEIISNTSRYFYTFGRPRAWPTVIGPRGADIFTVERTNNVVRITTKVPHGLIVNDKIIVSANTLTQLNNPPSTSSKTIISIERSSDVVTMTTLTAHGFTIGSTVEVITDNNEINGVFTVTNIVNSTSFRYVSRGNNIALTTSIDGNVSLYTAFTVAEVLSDLSFTYVKTGPNIQPTAEIGEVYSIEKDVISSEEDPPSASDNFPYELEVRNDMVFMKLIDANDASIVVPRRNWQPGIIYDMYDEYSGDRQAYSGASSLASSAFYVLTDEFHVYKCIFNNNDSSSSVKPTSTSPTSEEITLADGYIWKFMYTIPIALRNKFLTSEYMPVLSALANQFYSSGSITNYTIVSSGRGYISNTYKVTGFEIKNSGSGYLKSPSNVAYSFSITAIERSNNRTTIYVNQPHNLSFSSTPGVDSPGGALMISTNISSVVVGGNTVPLNLTGTKVIIDVNSSTSFVVENEGANIPYTTAVTGGVGLTGAIIEFPIPPVGSQTKAYVSQYGVGGTIERITILSQGFGYLTPPVPTIYSVNTRPPDTQVEYTVNYFFRDPSNGYTEVAIEGDGYNSQNPYSLKRVIIQEEDRGLFTNVITGEIFTFPDPDLPNGRKPQVNVVFDVVNSVYNVVESGRVALNGGTVVLTLDATPTDIAIGNTITVAGLTANPSFNGSRVITNVVANNVFFELAGTEILGVSETGTVTKQLGYEVGEVQVIDGGYGYSRPLKFGEDASGNYFSVFANDLTINDFNCSFDEDNQKNEAILLPLINAAGQIEAIQIIEPGVGYTYASVFVRGYRKINPTDTSLTLMTPSNTFLFSEANIQLRFAVGDIDSKQSTVELFAKSGSISNVKVENGGQNYASATRIVVVGDGTGCVVVPEISNGKIIKTTLVNAGTGYTTATAYISGPMLNNDPMSITPTSGTGASLRVILAPRGGHGRDAVSELYAKGIYFTTRISDEKINGITTSNDFRQVTILKNPSIYNSTQFYKPALGSACFLAICNINTNNTTAFNQIQKDDILLHLGQKKFVVVEKSTVSGRYHLVLQPIDNFIPEVNSVFTKTVGTNTYSIVMTAVQYPDYDKFSGEMLYINNRTNFTPSLQQTVVVSTLINF